MIPVERVYYQVEIELNKVKMKYKETVAAHQKQQQQAYFNNDVLHNATKELLADVDATKDEVAAVATWQSFLDWVKEVGEASVGDRAKKAKSAMQVRCFAFSPSRRGSAQTLRPR